MEQAHSQPPAAPGDKPSVNKYLVLLAVINGTFISTINTSIVNISLPTLSDVFGKDIATVQWVLVTYMLTVSCFILPFGRLGDIIGRRPVYMTGFVIFTLFSLLSAFAPSIEVLIPLRFLQGIGGAMLSGTGIAIATFTFPARERGKALGFVSMSAAAGLTVGPSVGGFLVQNFGWQSIFLVNVPLGLLGLAQTAINVRLQPNRLDEKMDIPGIVTYSVALTSGMLLLGQGGRLGPGSPLLWALLGTFIVFVVLFVTIERRVPHPTIDLNLFRIRLFSSSALSSLFAWECVFATQFLMPFYMERVLGYLPSLVGLILMWIPLLMSITTPISGTISDRIGSRTPACIGMGLMVVALLLLSTLGEQSGPLDVAWRLVVMGIGIGIFQAPNNSSLMGAAPRDRLGMGSGVLATTRTIGQATGVSIASIIFVSRLGDATGSAAFVGALHDTFLAVSIIAVVALIVSYARGKPLAAQAQEAKAK